MNCRFLLMIPFDFLVDALFYYMALRVGKVKQTSRPSTP